MAAQAGVPQLGASSLKAALDLDWDNPAARDQALAAVLGFLDQVGVFAAAGYDDETAAAAVAVAGAAHPQLPASLTAISEAVSPPASRTVPVMSIRPGVRCGDSGMTSSAATAVAGAIGA